jgi:photosystem II stability/assembly factor-like uncharacterized protein
MDLTARRVWTLLAVVISIIATALPAAAQAGNILGGVVQVIAVNPDDSTVVYVGTASGGVFKSTNGGSTWSSVTSTNLSRFVRDLAIDPVQTATLYAATGGLNGGVFKTLDGAASWTRRNVGISTSNVTAVAIDPVAPATIYTGTADGGMFKSEDGAATWSPINVGLTNLNVRDISVDPNDPSLLYVATAGGVFESTDRGANWTASSAGIADPNVLTIVVNPHDSSVLFAGTNAAGAFKSVDAAVTWVPSNQGLTALNPTVRHFAIDSRDEATVYAATFTGVFKSVDAGGTWSAANAGLRVLQNSAVPGAFHVAIDPSNSSTVFVGTNSAGGVFKSANDGTTWTAVNTGLTAVQVSDIVFAPQQPATVYAATTSDAVFKSVDAGATWFEANLGFSTVITLSLAIDPHDSSVIYAGTGNRGSGEGIFKSTSGGATWTRSGFGVVSAVQSLAVDPVNQNLVYAGTSAAGVFRSADGAATWTQINGGLLNLSVESVVVDPATPGIVYAGTANGVFKSTDAGVSWFTASVGLSNTIIHALAIDPVSTSTVYAGTDSGVFKSVNGGAAWQPASAGVPAPQIIHFIAIDPSQPSTIYLAKASGGLVFRSTDAGQTWADVSDGLPRFPTFASSLAVSPTAPSAVLAGTDSSGVFRIRLNSAPVANAGPDQFVKCACPKGTTVTLDASASSDPDGDPLTYSWTGPFEEVSGVVATVFLPPGTHVITLIVRDGRGGMDVDSVTVDVQHIPDGVDLDIAGFRVGTLFGSRPCAEPFDDIPVTLSVINAGTVDEARIATVVGIQSLGFGRSIEVYRAGLAVSSRVRANATVWSFPPFRRTMSGAITWTATIVDDNPDQDIRTLKTGLIGSVCQ